MKTIIVRSIRWALRLYYYRVQLVTSAITVALPLLVYSESVGGMVRGVFDIDTGPSLFLAGLMSALLMWGLRLPARLVRVYGPERFDFAGKGLLTPGSSPSSTVWRDAGWMLIGLVPIVAVLSLRVTESGWWGDEKPGIPGTAAAGYLALGAVVATGLYLAAVWVSGILWGEDNEKVMPLPLIPEAWSKKLKASMGSRHRLFTSDSEGPLHAVARDVDRLLGKMPKTFQAGILKDGKLLPGHFALVAYTVIAMAILVIVGLMDPSSVAPLVSLLSLLLAGCLVCSGIAYFFDRIPIPLSLILGVWMFGMSLVWRQSHVIEQVDAPGKVPVVASEVLAVDPENPADGYPILISAEGGGIHAGLWVTHVLEELMRDKTTDEEGREISLGPEFLKRVRCVSGVSGGSYGLMYFVNALASGDLDIKSRAVSKATGTSSLGAVVHGLVFSDILSTVLPVARGKDRGLSMEQDWLQHSPGLEGVLLSDWIPAVRARKCPAILFNATSVERGTPLVFGNTSFDATDGAVQDWLYAPQGGYSIPVVSAARASASFPFVTPAVRVKNEGREEHAVDGGYFDNYGMAVLTRWLHGALRTLRAKPPAQRISPSQILVIQIQAAGQPPASGNNWDRAPQVKPSQKPDPLAEGILTELTAPFQTLMSVRRTGQRQHNSDDLAMLIDIWQNPPWPGSAEAPPRVEIRNAVFTFRGSPPLSWHLTEQEKKDVTDIHLAEWHPENLGVVRKYLHDALEAEQMAKEKARKEKEEMPAPALAPPSVLALPPPCTGRLRAVTQRVSMLP